MAILRIAPLLALCLAAGLAAAEEESRLRGATRRLFDWAAAPGYIWGRCDDWTSMTMGCDLTQGYQCSHGLSQGPDDATIEIALGGLPASTAEQSVHLQWWTARESVYPYNPLVSPVGGAVYWWMADAYPMHDEGAFNGGNVRVDGNGEATIRVRPPATYRVANWVAMPHVHLRVCAGDAYAYATPDTVLFSHAGPPMVYGGNTGVFDLTVLSSRTLTTTTTTTTTLASLTGSLSFVAVGVDEPVVITSVVLAMQDALGGAFVSATVEVFGRRLQDAQWTVVYVVQVSELATDATFSAIDSIRSNDAAFSSLLRQQLVAAGADEADLRFDLREVKELAWVTTTTLTTTTTTVTQTTTSTRTTTTRTSITSTTATSTTTTTTKEPTPFLFEVVNTSRTVLGQLNPVDLRITSALDILDLDALEFSPVYHCLMEGRFFDYFSGGCSEECPADADAYIGQCVGRNVSDAHVGIQVAWSLQVQCAQDNCMHSKMEGTLHHVRIAVADHMNIPFQEVSVTLLFPEAQARRLQPLGPLRTAFLTVSVDTRRVTLVAGMQLLAPFLGYAPRMCWLLGLSVTSMERVEPQDVPALSAGQAKTADGGSDPYAPAYADEAARNPRAAVFMPGSDFLPAEAITGLAGGILALAGFFAVYIWRRRRQERLQALQEVSGKQVSAKLEDLDGPRKSAFVGAAKVATEEDASPAYPVEAIRVIDLDGACESNEANDLRVPGAPASPCGSAGFEEAARDENARPDL